MTWLFNWCKQKPTILLNIIHGTIKQLTENNESDSVLFSSEEFMDLEFKSWLCICENEYLKLVKVTLFEKLIDHNLIYDHNKFVCQELINSGMLLINLDILKSFIDDRNSFTINEGIKLGLYKNTISILNEPQISLNTHESMENASLDIGMNMFHDNEEISTTFPTNISAVIPFNTMAIPQEEIITQTEVQTCERKNTVSRKVIDETTLRIYFPRHR